MISRIMVPQMSGLPYNRLPGNLTMISRAMATLQHSLDPHSSQQLNNLLTIWFLCRYRRNHSQPTSICRRESLNLTSRDLTSGNTPSNYQDTSEATNL
jgi:hypothetical protein